MVVPPSVGGSSTATAVRSSPANGSSNAARGKSGLTLTGNGYHPVNNASLPLSARKAPPLDMSSVERRGQLLTSREMSKRVRPHGLQDAPTYRPTAEEFKDPMRYMHKIAPEGRKYGIVKIIPPDDWNPDFAIDTERFHFRTRRQELNSVEGGTDLRSELFGKKSADHCADARRSGTRANLNYLDQLSKFHKQHGANLNRFPSVDKRPLDLYKLKKAVEIRGGFEKVCKLKKWAEIGRDLGYSGKIMSSLSTSLKNSYQRWLNPYEEYLRVAKPGVQQQLEFEYGGPLTPSPANSPMKKSHQNASSSNNTDSPAIRASAALNASLKNGDCSEKDPSPLEAPRPVSSSSFTAVNSAGFTPVNASPSAFTPVNGIKRESDSGATPPHVGNEFSMSTSKEAPEYRLPAAGAGVNGATLNTLKRRLSLEAADIDPGKDANGTSSGDNSCERRSKRLKKEAAPTVAGSHMTIFRPSTPRIPGEPGMGKPGEKCEGCGKSDDATSLLLCDSCDHSYHRHCLDPPDKSPADHDWHCPRCLVGTGEFGFEEGGIYSLKQFQEKAHNFKESYFLPKMPFDPVLNCKRPVTEDDVEREFWRLVESLTETVEVEYGADIHSTTHGSGFPTIERDPLDPYSTDPWNLNILPLHSESLFRHIKSDISGMTVPWLYVGMCFSTFCWHNEDHYTYSANYQHFGSTKTWYGIPGEDADRFEEAMRQAVPELFETQPDLLFQLVTLLPPDQLKKAGVRVYALDQRAGQFVVTFPQAYHAGFNHGFNFNEAVNFAPSDWEPWGRAGVERLQAFRRQPCFSHDELLLTAAGRDTTIKTAKWLAPALERLRNTEISQRRALIARHKELDNHQCTLDALDDFDTEGKMHCGLRSTKDDEDLGEDEYQCGFCKAYSYLSRFQCHKSSKTVCLLHAGSFDCCDMDETHRLTSSAHSLRYRFSDEELNVTVQKLADRARVPEAWTEKLEKAIDDDPKPSLKVIRSLLSEGERIPYHLPQLASLKAFVERCNEWVDEAMNYIVRKQQNRRKNEKVWRKGNTAKAAELEERDREHRKIDNMVKLLEDADEISFDCPEIMQLQERAEAIRDFQKDAQTVLHNPRLRSSHEIEDLVEMGRGFNVDIPEVERLDQVVQQMKWNQQARDCSSQLPTLSEVCDLIQQGEDLNIPDHNEYLRALKEQKAAGELWESKAKELMSAEAVNYQQLEALSGQASTLPVSAETLAAIDQILNKQREAHRQIVSLFERSKDAELRNRPKYKDVREVLDSLTDLHSKPTGTIDLEKELKRHEDWMRKGKKLFGKANAPLHILGMHMQYVEQRNLACLDTKDCPRAPAEPTSRGHTPENAESSNSPEAPGRNRDVFCICRQPESGMMIECELCHEWYHGKCMKIARGKVKEDDKFSCPICDWRVTIPRDAARPKLEDLQDWQAEIGGLPFQPDEEECLARIVDHAQLFREFIRPFINPVMLTQEEVPTQRFYLRKIEGAELLLTYETNFFRQELHRWAPVANESPPVLDSSRSTRKPRPTKQQKLMAQLGIDNPDDLPQNLRTKPHSFTKRKSSEPSKQSPLLLQPAPGRSITPGNQMPSNPHGGTGSSVTAPLRHVTSQVGVGPGYDGSFALSSPSQDSPTFADGQYMPRQPGLRSPNFRSQSPGATALDPALFGEAPFEAQEHLDSPLNSPVANPYAGSQGPNMDAIFDDLTNQDVDGLGSSHAHDAFDVTRDGELEDQGRATGHGRDDEYVH
ncbi:MAG: hypothetical protein M1833_001891 [Piccolia ochrophora]|nr:MAG: hypothetical protein M1833_001891 [Piccolia ochrophora]